MPHRKQHSKQASAGSSHHTNTRSLSSTSPPTPHCAPMARGAAKRSDDDTDGNASQMSGMPPRAPSRLKKRQSSHRKTAGGGHTTGWALIWLVALGGVLGLLVYSYRTLVPRAQIVESQRSMPTPVVLEHHCKEHIGPPRIIRVTDTVWVAVGYDLANTILIKTSAGHVIVDVAMSPAKAKVIRQALIEAAGDAPIHTIIYTHSHIDHVGGASGWAGNATRIWATDAVTAHFFKQYGVFRKVESLRGSRQYGYLVPQNDLPCSALGARVDLDALKGQAGFLLPTDTFQGRASFSVGEEDFELIEAHGETHDMLIVWLPKQKVLLPGDNYYRAFPNLYTIRGTTPRPVRAWIQSLDTMRKLEPEYLVPSHTEPVFGLEAVSKQLTDYRDGIQWVYVETIRGANEGKSMDELASSVGLPLHLRDNDALDELYGQIDWSVRAIYSGELGWFDGQAEELYPLGHEEESQKTVLLMGGASKVLKAVEDAQSMNDHRWALHLLKMLRAVQKKDKSVSRKILKALEAASLRALGQTIFNTNGRAYLLQAAIEREGSGPRAETKPVLSDAFIDSIPISLMFEVLQTRLRPELSIDVHESAIFLVGGAKYIVTVRKGVAEVAKGEPLYGTPEPIGTFIADENTFRRIMLQLKSPGKAIVNGDVRIEGDQLRFLTFVQRFERGA